MALGRTHDNPSLIRDIEGDYIKAHLEEYHMFVNAGLQERANSVAVELRRMGHEVDKVSVGTKERAVADAPLEQAVESDAPKRRGRPPKTAE